MRRLGIVLLAFLLLSGAVFSQKNGVGKVKTVVIDPGHGGDKPGAITKNCKEKDIVLDVALKLGKVINDNFSDVEVIYTHKTDVDVSLAERAKMANRAKADLFISIHANSHPKGEAKGVETFVMGLSTSKANLEVAKKENADILLEDNYKNNEDYNGFDPNSPESYIMFSLYQNAFVNKSLTFAKLIQDRYAARIKTVNRGVKQAELFVLYKTTMPSILTEIGFISNSEEEKFLNSEEGRADIVYCLFDAFATYKAMEEGTKKIANPKIDIPGFVKNKPKKPAPKKDTATAKKDTAATGSDKKDSSVVIVAAQDSAKPAVPSTASVAPVADKEKAIYRIQFLTSEKALEKGSPMFKKITEYDEYKEGGKIKYITGVANNLDEAKTLQNKIKAQGFKDAFIVPFYKGERISYEEARRINSKK